MTERWGTHWKWRLGLLVAVVVLIGARYVAARSWKNRKLVANCGGPPAMVYASSIHKSAIEAWDWNGDQTRTLATIEKHPAAEGMLRAGKRVVWVAGGNLEMVDLEPPFARRKWKVPFQYEEGPFKPLTMVGASPDQRFVVVQYQRLGLEMEADGDVFGSHDLAVIDVETGDVVSNKHWHSQMQAEVDSGEFMSYYSLGTSTDPKEPNRGRWRLTESGDWELLATITTNARSTTIVRNALGHRRSLAADEVPKPDEAREYTTPVLHNQEHVVVRSESYDEFLVGHAESGEVQRLGEGFSGAPISFSDDEKYLIAVDHHDDIHVFETATGRKVAFDWSGSFWRWFVRGIASVWLVAAGAFLVTSWRQPEFRWGLIDLHLAGMTSQMALFGFLTTANEAMSDWLTPIGAGAGIAATVVFGMGVGWYWIHGNAPIIARLRHGVLSIVAIGIVPAAALLCYNPPSDMAYVVLVPAFSGLFFASVTAMVLAPFSMTGWRVSDRAIQARGRGFGLASMMLMITGVAVVMGFFKLDLLPPIEDGALDVAMFFVPVFAVGLLWPGIAMLNIGRKWRITIVVALGIILAAAMAGRIVLRRWGWDSGFDTDGVSVGVAGMTAVFMLHMMLLVRKFGWRWRRASAPAAELVPMEIAA